MHIATACKMAGIFLVAAGNT